MRGEVARLRASHVLLLLSPLFRNAPLLPADGLPAAGQQHYMSASSLSLVARRYSKGDLKTQNEEPHVRDVLDERQVRPTRSPPLRHRVGHAGPPRRSTASSSPVQAGGVPVDPTQRSELACPATVLSVTNQRRNRSAVS